LTQNKIDNWILWRYWKTSLNWFANSSIHFR